MQKKAAELYRTCVSSDTHTHTHTTYLLLKMVFSVNAMMTNTSSGGREKANIRRRIQSSLEATTSSSSFPPSSFIPRRRQKTMVSSPLIPRGATTMRIGEGSERGKSKRRRGMDVAATATSNETNASNNNNGGYAWRGDPIPTKSLPLLPNGKVDYSSIDKSPISKVLTSTIRKLLVKRLAKIPTRETTRILKR